MLWLSVNILGVLIFLFLFWKRMKEDYTSQIIFSSAVNILLGFGIGILAAKRFFPEYFFWGGVGGGLLGLLISVLRFRIRIFESLEALVIASLPMVVLMFMYHSAVNSSLVSFIAFIVCLLFLFAFYLLDAHYKEFSWYKSGKVGFSGLSTSFLFFTTRSLVAIFYPSVLSFVSKSEVYLSGSFAIISLVLIVFLGRQE